jgi:hypothetical protein
MKWFCIRDSGGSDRGAFSALAFIRNFKRFTALKDFWVYSEEVWLAVHMRRLPYQAAEENQQLAYMRRHHSPQVEENQQLVHMRRHHSLQVEENQQ